MTNYYTQEVSDRILNSLHSIDYPFTRADFGFTVPDLVDLAPTYAEVLDWLIKQDFHISIIDNKNNDYVFGEFQNKSLEDDHVFYSKDFDKLLEEMIFYAVDLLRMMKDE